MKKYLNLVQDILDHGSSRDDRTGVGTIGLFGAQLRFDLSKEFPILSAKFTPFKTTMKELIWLISGNTNVKWLQDNNCTIWDEWADENGELGPIYGQQWRAWEKYRVQYAEDSILHSDGSATYFNAKVKLEHIDQLQEAIKLLVTDPTSRRIIVAAWNASDLKDMALTPCHAWFQFYSQAYSPTEAIDAYLAYQQEHPEEKEMLEAKYTTSGMDYLDRLKDLGLPTRKLSCQLYQRSADMLLGVPMNIVSYAALTHMIANITNHAVGEFIWTGGDVHIYKNHLAGAREMLARDIIPNKAKIWVNPDIKEIDKFTLDDIKLENYVYHPKIDLPVAV